MRVWITAAAAVAVGVVLSVSFGVSSPEAQADPSVGPMPQGPEALFETTVGEFVVRYVDPASSERVYQMFNIVDSSDYYAGTIFNYVNPVDNMLGGARHDTSGALKVPTFRPWTITEEVPYDGPAFRGQVIGWDNWELAIFTEDSSDYVCPGHFVGVVVDGMDVVDQMVALLAADPERLDVVIEQVTVLD